MKGKFTEVCAIHKKEDCYTCPGIMGFNQWKKRLEDKDYEWLIRDLASFPNDQIKAIQLCMIIAQTQRNLLDRVGELQMAIYGTENRDKYKRFHKGLEKLWLEK